MRESLVPVVEHLPQAMVTFELSAELSALFRDGPNWHGMLIPRGVAEFNCSLTRARKASP